MGDDYFSKALGDLVNGENINEIVGKPIVDNPDDSISKFAGLKLVDKLWDDDVHSLTDVESTCKEPSDNNQSIVPLKTTHSALSDISLLDKIRNAYRSLKVQNIVASVYSGTEIDLRQVAISTRSAEYNPKKVNALIFRLMKPKCTSLIFQTGRIMVTGSKAREDAKAGAKTILKLLVRVLNSDKIRFKNFKIENIIATANCYVPVRLEALAQDYRAYCSYEPEVFAGLVYRYPPMRKTNAVVLIFVSGKIIITGCKSMREINRIFGHIFPILRQYQF